MTEKTLTFLSAISGVGNLPNKSMKMKRDKTNAFMIGMTRSRLPFFFYIGAGCYLC